MKCEKCGHAQRPLWRDDMENAPKDRPFLVYWRLSKIYGVVEWNKDHWEDQAGDKVLAFRNWREFELYAVTSTECAPTKFEGSVEQATRDNLAGPTPARKTSSKKR